jgi:hypothetical protein
VLVLLVATAASAEASCAAASNTDLEAVAAKLAQCRAEGRDAGTYDAYERCKAREGITP